MLLWYLFDLWGDIGAKHLANTTFPSRLQTRRCFATPCWRCSSPAPWEPPRSPFYSPADASLTLLQKHRVWRGVLAVMLVPLAFIAFWPSPVDHPIQGQLASTLYLLHRHGVPAWVNYAFIEAAANVAIFIPLGIVGSLAFPAKLWWQLAALGMLVSGCIELGQHLFLHDRFATLSDVVTNTAGAALGALSVTLIRHKFGVHGPA